MPDKVTEETLSDYVLIDKSHAASVAVGLVTWHGKSLFLRNPSHSIYPVLVIFSLQLHILFIQNTF
jgi:hypothetical protein